MTLTGADTASASFTAPVQLTQDTTLTFTLTVTDARNATGTDTVTVTVTAGANDTPVADAGTPQTVGEGATVTLTGTGTDPEGDVADLCLVADGWHAECDADGCGHGECVVHGAGAVDPGCGADLHAVRRRMLVAPRARIRSQ